MEFLDQINVENLFKVIAPSLILILTTSYKYIVESRISLEYIITITTNILQTTMFYYLFTVFSNFVYGEDLDINFLFYFTILIFLEFLYIANINKKFKIVKYKNTYYRLIKYKKDYLKVQDYDDIINEYSCVSSNIGKDMEDNNFKNKENLYFGTISYKEFTIIDDSPIETTKFYLHSKSSMNRDLKIKRKVRFIATTSLLIIYFSFSYFNIRDTKSYLSMIILAYFLLTNLYITLNINKVRLSNRIHIIKIIKSLNESSR